MGLSSALAEFGHFGDFGIGVFRHFGLRDFWEFAGFGGRVSSVRGGTELRLSAMSGVRVDTMSRLAGVRDCFAGWRLGWAWLPCRCQLSCAVVLVLAVAQRQCARNATRRAYGASRSTPLTSHSGWSMSCRAVWPAASLDSPQWRPRTPPPSGGFAAIRMADRATQRKVVSSAEMHAHCPREAVDVHHAMEVGGRCGRGQSP